jgi:hypothetical protein
MRGPINSLIVGMILLGAWAAPLAGGAAPAQAAGGASAAQAATPPAPTPPFPGPTPATPAASADTTVLFVVSVLALAFSAAVVGGLWVLTRASRTLPRHEGLVVIQVVFGTTLAGILLAMIWLPGRFLPCASRAPRRGGSACDVVPGEERLRLGRICICRVRQSVKINRRRFSPDARSQGSPSPAEALGW